MSTRLHEARPSRREFLATSAAAAATGVLAGQEPAQGANDDPRPCTPTGIPTGFEELDGLTGGLHRSELVLLASEPTMDKTALALNFADFISVEARTPTLYVSLGTSRVELARRLLRCRGEICRTAMYHRTLPADVGQRLTQAGAELSHAPLYIDDQPLQTAAEIRTVAKRLDQRLAPRGRLGLVVVDHLHRIEVEDTSQPASCQLADIAYELQGLARQMNVAVLCLMQLNCAPYVARENRATRLAFPGIHREADVVLLLHRSECRFAANGAQEEGSESKAQLSVIRRRDRLAEKVGLSWNGRYGRFSGYLAPQ